ncbi:MAG TPA: amidohydrolase family protein [Candidatus Acidoferrum sp.]|nr:amidohydrolase family protein [Candidatus Acidoferrum sp.]
MRTARVATILLFLTASSTAVAATKAIKFGKLVDGTGRVLTNAVVTVDDDRVRSVASGNVAIPSGAEVIDLSRYTGIPGLIDAHTHITYYWDGNTTPRYEPPRHPAVTAFLAQENAQKALDAGVTTIRNLNSLDGIDLAMRDLINMGKMIGPRMFVSGLGIRITRSTAPPAPIGIMADGVDAVIHAVRQVIASGADWVKMYGSTGGFDDVTQAQTFTYEEMKAAVDATHALGKKIAIHSYGPGGARDAVRAGTDSLEHATDMDDQTIAEMVKRKTYYAPTIDHNQYYVENADTVYHFPPGAKERLLDYIQRNFETAKKAFQAGVHMIVGSDAVYNGWGLNMRELDWFVKMGMTPEQALKAATTEPAAMLGLEKSLGAVAPGFYADIVAVEGDPLANITAVSRRENIRWVMKAGRVVVDKITR